MKLVAAAVGLSLALVPACKHKPDLSKYKDRATSIAAKYAPKLAELSKHLPDLAAHAKDLPVNVPGADKLASLITENKGTLESAQQVLNDLPNKLGADSPEQAEKDLDAAEKTLATDVATAEAEEKQEADIEAKGAAASGSAVPGTAPSSGVPAAGSATPAAGSPAMTGSGSAK